MVQRVNVQYVQYYTQGSVARRILPAIKTRVASLPRNRKQKVHRIYVDPVAALGTLVAVCMLIMMAVGVSQLQSAQQKTAVIEQQIEQLQMENRVLRAEYASQCDLDAVEQTALALGMIPQQEATHITISVELPQQQQQITLWHKLGTFLTGIFA